ncbi:type I polyketide synthase [Paludibacterium paludis]|uniref:Acyl transferase domain-containing protein n=1 Tax=Paludibacterium paludis TaxID=1225769 RepID=A0A918P3I6_9NEIS|nr:type I polyketide synthase [Paludibacterium paludis]GGY18423.1 hypothetical protein GCM10011289_22400 [Paludibacterium paludis]
MTHASTDIAIIGAAGRFPGADSVAALWRLLLEGKEPYRILGPEQLAAAGHAELARSPRYVPLARLPDDYDCFDAGFFGYSPREAAFMDPQQRLLLECAWHVFEQAGHIPEDRDGMRTAVFASVGANGYLPLHALPRVLAGQADMLDVLIGNDKDYAATRIAYKLNLSGPALSVQTACSSSLVAVHLAVQSLLAFEADRALVASASLAVPAETGYLAEESGIRSPDGHCRPFDADSNGTVFGSGVAGVLLRRLDDALADGDTPLAVIRASAVNNDAAARVGFTAPGLQGQIDVIAEALQMAELDAADIGYVECHGTGTQLGDPVEIDALSQALRACSRAPLPPAHCLVGSVKSNIGHLDACAGLAGLIKTACSLREGVIPPTLHYRRPNPRLELDATPFRVVDRRMPWPADRPRLAGVSAFGFGGTNAHLILAAPPAPPATGPARTQHCLPLSAADGPALRRQAENLADWLDNDHGHDLADVAFTLQTGRKALSHRAVVVAADIEQASAALRRMRGSEATLDQPWRALWLFPGQGSHHPGMAAALYREEPLFRSELEHLLGRMAAHRHAPAIRALLLDADGATDDTAIVQPALFAFEVALGRYLLALGLEPAALLGHSLGELSAACLAGVFGSDDACDLVCLRGELMAGAEPGGMAALWADADDVQAWLETHHPGLERVVVNAPRCCVVGGPESALGAALADAEKQGWPARRLRVSRAFHSRMMEPALAVWRERLTTITLSAPRWPMISAEDGQCLDARRACDPGYWARQLRQPVRFDLALLRTRELPRALPLEIGPGGGLIGFYRDTVGGEAPAFELCGSRHLADSERYRHFLGTLGQLWQAGAPLAWPAFNRDHLPRRKVALPGYPFARERHWLPSSLPVLAKALANRDVPAAEPAADPAAERPVPAGIRHQPRPAQPHPFRAPVSDAERLMAALWQDLLFIDDIGLDDDFFALGGNSILALRLCQEARSRGWTLTPAEVFQSRTVAALCRHLDDAAAAAPHPAPARADIDPADLAVLLQRLENTESA